MNMETAIADARSRIAALDLSAENARADEINAQLAQIEQARATARARYDEILVLLRPHRKDGGSLALPSPHGGLSVADALLAGAAPSKAAATMIDVAQLEHERDALKEGMGELTRRERALCDEKRLLPGATGRRIMAELEPLCELLEQQARAGAQEVERAFAALSAIGGATRTQLPAMQATAEAVAGMRGGRGLLRADEMVDVPAAITEMLSLLADKGSSYKGTAPTAVQMRYHGEAATIASAGIEDRLRNRFSVPAL